MPGTLMCPGRIFQHHIYYPNLLVLVVNVHNRGRCRGSVESPHALETWWRSPGGILHNTARPEKQARTA